MRQRKTIDQLREGLENPSRYKNAESRAAAKRKVARIAAGMCRDCGKKPPLLDKRQCEDCALKGRQAAIAWVDQMVAANLCRKCGKEPAASNRQSCKSCLAYWCQNVKESYERLKAETFKVYGGPICACCGEVEYKFLTMDHVHNNGNAHRRAMTGENRAGGGHKLYYWLKQKNFPPGYQVLCMNCNFGKRMNNGVCPHKQT